MNGQRRDPIQDWADVSARAAAASRYRPSVEPRVRPVAGWSIGALALAVAVVVAGLSLRPGAVAPGGSASPGPSSPVVDRMDDGMFRLELTTPRDTYTPADVIQPVASVTYLGPEASITIFHATRSVQFRIDEVGGSRVMAGGTRLPCLSTILTREVPSPVAFEKSGNTDAGFDVGWYQDPVLRLPVGTWRISASLAVFVGDGDGCGAERHRIDVSNVIKVVAAPAQSAAPSASPVASRAPAASDAPAVPVVDREDDGVFRLELTTPRSTYGPDAIIEPVATVTYLGPDAEIEVLHAAQPIGFTIEEVDGKRTMGGGMDQPCKSTTLTRGVPLAVPFMKGGSPDATFDQAWYMDPVLRLPAGTWRIAAFLDIWIGDGGGCGAVRHQLVASNVVVVVAGSTTPGPSLSADAGVVLELVRKYEDGLATGHEDVSWTFLSPWSQSTVGSLATFVDHERPLAQDTPGPVVIEDPSQDPALLDAGFLGARAADLAAFADPDRTFVVTVRRPDADGSGTSTEQLVVGPIDGEWLIWIDSAPGSYGASPDPSG